MSVKNFNVSIVVTILCIFLLLESNAQTGPGGVGNTTSNKIWLKADEGILDPTPNSRVGLWVDQSGNNFNAVQSLPGNRPSYQIGGLNGRPYIHFDRTSAIQYFELTTFGIRDLITFNHTTFIIAKANSGSIDNSANAYQGFVVVPGYHSGIGVSGHPQTTNAFMTHWVGVWHNGRPTRSISINTPLVQNTWTLFSQTMFQNSNGVTQTGFVNGSQFGSISDPLLMANYTPQLMRIGTGSTSGTDTWALNGDISEVIVFNKSLNEAERIMVENYLSSKYNLPIANDKFTFDGPNEFFYNVAGIGRKTSSSIHLSSTSDLLTIGNANALDDDEYILLGNNNQPISLSNSNSPSGTKRLSRVWRTNITGSPGAVTVSFKVQKFSLPTGQSYRLLVDSDGDFSNATMYSGSVVNDVFTLDTPVNLIDGDFLTLALTENGPSTAVSLSYSPAKILLTYADSHVSPAPHVSDGGATASFSIINAPAGITIDQTTGQIHVTYAAAGTHTLTIVATNSHGSSTFASAYTLVIYPFLASKWEYAEKTISYGNSIDPILSTLPPNAYQYSVLSGSLNGLSLNPNSGSITGTFSSEGRAAVVLRATPQAPNATGSPITTVLNVNALGSTGPGGVGGTSNNKIWLDASYITSLSNGSSVSTLQDRSGNGWNAVQNSNSGKPTYHVNQLNGKPVLRFDRSASVKFFELNAPGIGWVLSNSNTILIVAKANAGARGTESPLQSLITIPGFHSGVYFAGYPSTISAYFQSFVGGTVFGQTPTTTVANNISLTQGNWHLLTRSISGTNSTSQTASVNGTVGPPSKSTVPMTRYLTDLARIGVGNLTGTQSLPFHGDLAEIILYNTTLNEPQKIILENYLASKYGLTISNDKYSAHDLLYRLDVQGIGTTDGTVWNKHSISSNGKGLKLTEANNTLNATDEFLFAGHAVDNNANINADLPSTLSERWQRVWFIEKTGTIDAKLSFDFGDAGLTIPSNLSNQLDYYKVLYRATPNGPFTFIPVIPTIENGDELSFVLTNAQLTNGYYTLGNSQGLVWTGSQDEQWNNPANWSLNRVPTANEHVVINSCTTCPVLSTAVTIAVLRVNDGGKISLNNKLLSVSETTFINGATIQSNQGIIQSADYGEVKNSKFTGAIVLEKTGGSANEWYGGNIFSLELKLVNSSSQPLQVSTQASNTIQRP